MPDSAGPPPLPPFYELAAPQDWRSVDFVSDLHLCEAMPRTFERFAAYLRCTKADAVFILGDLFELWVGDDARSRPFEAACLRFHDNPRAVRTPSSEQVRTPIFRDALEQWRHYEPWLGPLRDALG